MKNSSLTELETLQISASVASIFDKKWNCYSCMTHKHFEKYKKVKGCVSTPKTNYKIEGFELNKCLGNFATREIYSYIEMHKLYEQGIMPFAGPMVEQPAKLIDMFNMISQLKQEHIDKIESKRK